MIKMRMLIQEVMQSRVLNLVLSFDFLALLGFWNKILVWIDCVNKQHEDHTMNFNDGAYD